LSKLKGGDKLSVAVELVMFTFRLFFYVFALMDAFAEKDSFEQLGLSVIWIIVSMVVPMCFWVPLVFKRGTYFCYSELLLNGSLTIYVMMIFSDTYTSIFIISALLISFHLEKRHYWLLVVIAFFPFVQFFIKGILPTESPFFYIFNHWFLMVIGFGLNLIIKSYKNSENLSNIIEEQNQTLVQYAKQIESLTLVEERNRMARDLHDTLGHSFISYILGLDAVMYLIDSNTPEAKKKIEELRNYASENLDQIRETIHEIGTETDISITNNFSAIMDEFSEYTSTKVDFKVIGEEYVLHHSMRMALLRCLQESLTNAKRHGNATEISIQLSFIENEVELVIVDNGKGSEKVEYGFGLTSMQERLTALNGAFKMISSKSLGTTVTCHIPYRR